MENPMNKPIVVHMDIIGVGEYFASDEDAEIVLSALKSYGFLLKVPPKGVLRRWSFGEFADAIESVYDMAEPRTAATVQALRRIQLTSELREQGITDYCGQVCGGGECGSGPTCVYGIDPRTHLPGIEHTVEAHETL
jgi:hypothetical protein